MKVGRQKNLFCESSSCTPMNNYGDSVTNFSDLALVTELCKQKKWTAVVVGNISSCDSEWPCRDVQLGQILPLGKA